MQPDDTGVSELISEIMIILLVIGITIIILVTVLGVSLPVQKTAYIKTSASAVNISGNSVVMVDHNQGDPASLYPSTTFGYPLQFTMTNGSVTYTAIPLPSALSRSFRSGSSIYLVRNASGLMLADDPLQVSGNTGFSLGAWTISIIDKTSDTLVAQHTVILKGNTSSSPAVYTRYPGFTVEAWVKWNQNPAPTASNQAWATIVVDGTTDNNRRYQFQHNSDNSKFEFALATATMVGSGTWVASTTTPVSGTWYHVTGVYNKTPGTMAISVNGVQQSNKNVGAPGEGLRASPGKYQVGGPAGIQWPGPTSMLRKFNGDISGLKTYEEAFSQAEILAHYSAGHA